MYRLNVMNVLIECIDWVSIACNQCIDWMIECIPSFQSFTRFNRSIVSIVSIVQSWYNRCMVINAHFVVSTNHQKKYVLQCALKMSTLLCTPHPNWKWCAHPNWKRVHIKTENDVHIKTENDVHIKTENDVHPNWKWCARILPVDLNYET